MTIVSSIPIIILDMIGILDVFALISQGLSLNVCKEITVLTYLPLTCVGVAMTCTLLFNCVCLFCYLALVLFLCFYFGDPTLNCLSQTLDAGFQLQSNIWIMYNLDLSLIVNSLLG